MSGGVPSVDRESLLAQPSRRLPNRSPAALWILNALPYGTKAAGTRSSTPNPTTVLNLQRFAGNSAVTRLLDGTPIVQRVTTGLSHILDQSMLVDLQSRAGNRAVVSLLASRVPLQRSLCCSSCESGGRCQGDVAEAEDEAPRGAMTAQRSTGGSPEPKQTFDSARFQECPDCVIALHGRPLKVGEHGPGVGVLQQALADSGSLDLMPKTFSKGQPDQVWGQETTAAVHSFQADHGVRPVGGWEAGPRTFTALDDFFGAAAPVPPSAPCADTGISQEADPVPEIAPPSVRVLPADDLFAIVRRVQPEGSFVPSSPPLGATIPRIEEPKPITTHTVPLGDGSCMKCVAEWTPPAAAVEVLVATGVFSDEKLFWVTQPGDSGDCPTPVPRLKDVRKVIMPGALPMILAAEAEHVADFRRAFQIVMHRHLSNVGRLAESRTHLRGRDESECIGKIQDFLANRALFRLGGGRALALPPQLLPSEVYVPDMEEWYAQSGQRRDGKHSAGEEHTAVSIPPKSMGPVKPTFDLDRNPFGCDAFFRKFDERSFPQVPGASSEAVIVDLGHPAREQWHAL